MTISRHLPDRGAKHHQGKVKGDPESIPEEVIVFLVLRELKLI
jgi:hypothetical protein